MTNSRRVLLVAIGQHRPAYKVEDLSADLESCVSAALECMSKLSALHSELGEDHQHDQCDKVDGEMEVIEQQYSAAVEGQRRTYGRYWSNKSHLAGQARRSPSRAVQHWRQ